MKEFLAIIISYFIGGILTAGIVASTKRVDLTRKGSGNPGATNAFRIFGPFFGGLVLLGDVIKGVVGTMMGKWLGGGSVAVVVLCGLAVVAGHNWPLYYKFRGGKGMATSVGAIIVLVPKTLLVIAPIWILVVAISRYVSLGSIAAALALPVATYFFYPQQGFLLIFAVVASVSGVFRHRANIQRLLAGEENKLMLQEKRGGNLK